MGKTAHDGPLWAITCYFNPAKYWNRRKNYRLFHQCLSVPLVTIELSFDGQFELESSDADILIQKSGGDVMWQKERLLNIALGALPKACEFVIWLDCDVIFQRVDWPEQVCRELNQSPLLQPYSLVHHLPRGVSPEQWKSKPAGLVRPSVAWLIAQGVSVSECLGNPLAGFPGIRAPGHAWAARREEISRHGFYDACIIGGGDSRRLAGSATPRGALAWSQAAAEGILLSQKSGFLSLRVRLNHSPRTPLVVRNEEYVRRFLGNHGLLQSHALAATVGKFSRFPVALAHSPGGG